MSIQVWRKHTAFPAQWLYGLYDFVLVTGFLATIVSFSFRFRQLDASTGASDPNDFAVRKDQRSSVAASRPPLPCPAFATMAYAPLVGQDVGSPTTGLPDGASGIFLATSLDETNHFGIAVEISLAAQRRIRPKVYLPHGEERVFARLRTMHRIAGRTMRPAANPSRRRLRGSSDEFGAQNPFKSGSSVWPSSSWTPNVFSSIETWVYWPTANTTSMRCCSLKCFVSSVQTGSLMK